MGQVLHGSARTTAAVRRAIQTSQASIRSLAQQYGINPKTVTKWRKRADVQDAPMGPKQAHSTILTTEEEALIVAFRKHTLLPLDDCLYVLQETIPHLTRSALHRCLQRHGISRLSEVSDKSSNRIPSAIFTSTSLRCRRKRVSCTCLSPLTALLNLPSLSYTSARTAWWLPNSFVISSPLCPTKSTLF